MDTGTTLTGWDTTFSHFVPPDRGRYSYRVLLSREAGHHQMLDRFFVDVKQMFLNANADAGRGRLCAVQLSLPPSPTGRGAGKQTHALVRDCHCCIQQNNQKWCCRLSIGGAWKQVSLVGGRRSPHVGIFFPCVSWQQVAWGAKNSMNLVDPASSYMLVSRTKPCKSKN